MKAVRELKRQVAAADALLRTRPDDIDAKRARIAAAGALAAATADPVQRRRAEFLRGLETCAGGEGGPGCSCGADWSLPLDQHRPGTDVEHQRIGDPRDVWHPLTFVERVRLMPVVMDVWFLVAHYGGWRDRMRCPRCTAVGTWKMHGTWWERWRFGDIALRRWGCKWCGHWIARGKPNGPDGAVYDGRIVAFPLSQEGLKVWAYPDPSIEREPTPAEVLYTGMGRTWPWYG